MRRPADEPELFDLRAALPEGLVYRPEFLSREEETRLLEEIGRLAFGEVRMHGVTARRRIVQFGWRYGFDSRALAAGTPVPDFLRPVQERVADLMGQPPERLSEVLVTEYAPGATIGWHRDAPPFDTIAGISLGSACRFRLRRQARGDWERTELRLEPRSAYMLGGPARAQWQHSIPPVDSLRYSITFRTLRKTPPHQLERTRSNSS